MSFKANYVAANMNTNQIYGFGTTEQHAIQNASEFLYQEQVYANKISGFRTAVYELVPLQTPDNRRPHHIIEVHYLCLPTDVPDSTPDKLFITMNKGIVVLPKLS